MQLIPSLEQCICICICRFHISNTDHIMDVVQGGAPAPAINIVCPHYLNGASPQEQHIIYSVQVF